MIVQEYDQASEAKILGDNDAVAFTNVSCHGRQGTHIGSLSVETGQSLGQWTLKMVQYDTVFTARHIPPPKKSLEGWS